MSITITIAGTPIDFPSSGQSPNWAPAVIQFAQAVELALQGSAGPFDVPTQSISIDADNPGTSVDITALTFPPSDVRAAFIRYAVFRQTSLTTAVESGTLGIVYNPIGPVGNKWEVTRDLVGPGAFIDFYVTDTGQVQFSTTTLSGTNHVGTITFLAQSLPIS